MEKQGVIDHRTPLDAPTRDPELEKRAETDLDVRADHVTRRAAEAAAATTDGK